jgi:G3E family GTPase
LQFPALNGVVDPEPLFNLGLYNPKTKSLDAQRWLSAEAYPDSDARPSSHAHQHLESYTGHEHLEEPHSHDVNRHDAHIRALCLWIDRPIPAAALDSWLKWLVQHRGPDLLRVKGIVNVIGYNGPFVVHGVQELFQPPVMLPKWPSAERRTRIVFITRDIQEAELRETLSFFCEAQPETGAASL